MHPEAELSTEGDRVRVPSASRDPRRNSVADKSPKKSSGKTAAAKTLKEKRVEKKDKTAAKRKAE